MKLRNNNKKLGYWIQVPKGTAVILEAGKTISVKDFDHEVNKHILKAIEDGKLSVMYRDEVAVDRYSRNDDRSLEELRKEYEEIAGKKASKFFGKNRLVPAIKRLREAQEA